MQKIKKQYLVLVLILACIFRTAFLYAQPEEILLKHDSLDGERDRPPVLFPHELHMDNYECLDCHHKYEKGENVLDEAELEDGNPSAQCITCHEFKTNCCLQKVFHKQCMGCHVEKRKPGEKKGPRKCNGCHTPQRNQKLFSHP